MSRLPQIDISKLRNLGARFTSPRQPRKVARQKRAGVRLGMLEIAKRMPLWINDGLMAVFFQLVGLWIKGEVAEGELSHWSCAALPSVTA
jgi:Na+/H+ antiporter NhaA